MTLETYLKKHPDIREYWLQSGDSFCLCKTEDFDTINRFGWRRIKNIEEEPDEVITIHI